MKIFFSEIKKVSFDKIKCGQDILSLLKNHDFSKALYRACCECDLESHETLKLIKILLLWVEGLGINTGLYPVSLLRVAVDKSNINLYCLLVASGFVDEKAMYDMALKNNKTVRTFENDYHPEFLETYQALIRKNQGELQNDIQRISFILKVIDFLINHQTFDSRLTKTKKLSSLARQLILDKRDEQNRILLTKMCELIQNLSPELRIKFAKSFDTPGFSWLTFEHLGGLMIEPSEHKEARIPFSLISREKLAPFFSGILQFLGEVSDTQEIIALAAQSIIERDLPALRDFFKEVLLTQIKPGKPEDLPHVKLPVTKFLVSYCNDLLSLIKLINLVNSSHARIKLPITTESGALKVKLFQPVMFTISKNMPLHAGLRRLQMLGELMTGKHFSKLLMDLDPTTDWRAFITIRDSITHQDEKDLKHRLSQFLQDKEWLQQIFDKDMIELSERLIVLLTLRQQCIGSYPYDVNAYWQQILKHDLTHPAQENNNNSKQEVVKPIEQKLSREEKDFIDTLILYNAPPAIVDMCTKIFQGYIQTISKKERGEILKCFPKKVMGDKSYKELITTLDKATEKPALTLADREKKRLDEKAASESKEAEKEAKFKGLQGFRKLAKYLQEPVKKEHLLNPLKRVEAAIEALQNIEQFLIEVGYLIPSLPFKTLNDWDKYHVQKGRGTLSSRFVADPQLNDAIEYNLGQALQHLETLHTYPEFASCPLIVKDYPHWREYRNYLEHGNPLIDNQNHIYQQNDYKEVKNAKMTIQLLFELMPILQNGKSSMEKAKWAAKELHPGSSVSSNEQREWTKVCGNGNSFFSNSPDKPEEKTGKMEITDNCQI
ncbi:Uncharacterised protein [Legionella hackeliae]|uniref:hypothetical protein n=1 Tax=Legionella hackeliae TaxID=449 RepID=UPI000E13F70A|nr:hypothetical protein [Legionella hackeliae]STX49038.1 Uncharacterised protein [Legionella hackeliae]